MGTILRVENLHVAYGKFKVLHELSFEVEEGEVLGVIGPNGAGKTTLMNALTGLVIPYEGNILFDGHTITKLTSDRRCRLGLGRTYQVPRPFEGLTVFENVLVGASYGTGGNERTTAARAIEVLKSTDLYEKSDIVAGKLTLLDRKRMEIARALATEPRLLLLDEVAAGLTDAEVREVMRLVDYLKQTGITIIWIEHVIKTMAESTDKLLCLATGTRLIYGDPQYVMHSKEVEEVYLGVEEE
ncbi:MAG: ABC transporter ATP-binding protein [Clostridiales Family XIII bacterium]|jgi:branched-chain amino acid transport system ATP-binding protein|nr:ABC transporter ATP-binding protein [Clostridiales Family XIII bacterium]